jgi:hypothetical protein
MANVGSHHSDGRRISRQDEKATEALRNASGGAAGELNEGGSDAKSFLLSDDDKFALSLWGQRNRSEGT